MSARRKLEKWGIAALGAVCVLLAFNVLSDISKDPAPASHPQESSSALASPPIHQSSLKGVGKWVESDPSLQLNVLKDYPSTPFPEVSRNPFDFVAAPVLPSGPAGSSGLGAAGVAPVPQKPEVPLQALGYAEKMGVGGEAYLADQDQVYVVHKGDVVSNRFRVVRITPSAVEVFDETSRETTQLSIPLPE